MLCVILCLIDLKTYGIDIGTVISGAFGAVLLITKTGVPNTTKALCGLLGGAASANYLTPTIISLARLDSAHDYHYAIAFLMGFLGLRGVEFFSNLMMFMPRSIQIPPEQATNLTPLPTPSATTVKTIVSSHSRVVLTPLACKTKQQIDLNTIKFKQPSD